MTQRDDELLDELLWNRCRSVVGLGILGQVSFKTYSITDSQIHDRLLQFLQAQLQDEEIITSLEW
jgi:hypothetical protein